MVLGTHVWTFRLIDVIITMYEHVSPTMESISPMGLGWGRKLTFKTITFYVGVKKATWDIPYTPIHEIRYQTPT